MPEAMGPTLEEIRQWPAAVPLPLAAAALGVSRATAYRLVGDGTFPVRVIKVGPRRTVVVTADLIRLLCGEAV